MAGRFGMEPDPADDLARGQVDDDKPRLLRGLELDGHAVARYCRIADDGARWQCHADILWSDRADAAAGLGGEVCDTRDHDGEARQEHDAERDDNDLENAHLARIWSGSIDGGLDWIDGRHAQISSLGNSVEPMTKHPERLHLEIPPEAAGERIDRFLASRLEDLSRSRIQALIRAGHVSDRRGTIEDPGARVKPGDTVAVSVPPAEPAEPMAEDIPLHVVWEDDDLIVIDKPAGLVVHPAAGHATGTLVNALIAHCGTQLSGIGGTMRPGIVHRLDKDTSGLLVVAKSDAAHKCLAQQFAAHGANGQLERAYLAFAWGDFHRPSGTVDAPLARSVKDRTKITVVKGDQGRRAVTHYQVVETYPGIDGKIAVSQVRLRLETGRTHQIRVHLAHAGHPLLGDPTYGSGFAASARRLGPAARLALAKLHRQALHATLLAFEHPRTGKRLKFESPLPADLRALRAALRGAQDQP